MIQRKKKKKSEADIELSLFFKEMEEKLANHPYSQESNNQIAFNYRFSVCHIFPKRIYKSVQSDEQNIVFLTVDEHTRFDHLFDCMEFDKMKEEFPRVWDIMMERLDYLDGKITERKNHIENLLSYLRNDKKRE